MRWGQIKKRKNKTDISVNLQEMGANKKEKEEDRHFSRPS